MRTCGMRRWFNLFVKIDSSWKLLLQIIQVFLHKCATCSELPSTISTRGQILCYGYPTLDEWDEWKIWLLICFREIVCCCSPHIPFNTTEEKYLYKKKIVSQRKKRKIKFLKSAKSRFKMKSTQALFDKIFDLTIYIICSMRQSTCKRV